MPKLALKIENKSEKVDGQLLLQRTQVLKRKNISEQLKENWNNVSLILSSFKEEEYKWTTEGKLK